MEGCSSWKLGRKTRDLAIAGTLLSTVYLTDCLSETTRPTPIWGYNSEPPHVYDWDRLFRVMTNPLMNLLAGGMVSHPWDWIEIPDSQTYSQRWKEPLSDNFFGRFDRKGINNFHYMLGHSIFGVQEVLVVGLDLQQLQARGLNPEGFYYGFQIEGMDKIQRSRVLIPVQEQIRVLISTGPLRVLTLDSQNNELPSEVLGPFDRKDKKLKHLRQF